VVAIAGSMLARGLAGRDARRDSDRRVELATALIGSRIGEATSLATSLRRFISTEGAAGVTNDQFERIALRWLSPAEVPAAAWVEEIPAGERAGYERRLGHVIVTPEQLHKPEPPRSSYLPATLVSGYPPIDIRGIDLGREPGMLEAIARAESPGGVAATPFATRRDGTRGLFLVAQSANVIYGQLRPGAVVIFVSEQTLRAAARNPAGLEFVAAGSPADDHTGAATVREELAVPGGRLAIVMPRASVTGAGAVLPWLIFAAGLVLAALAGALGVNAARRTKAKADLDRIFNLSPDLIAVADFEGRFTRVNPAAERTLGYTEEELLERPILDFVHPDDREKTAAEAASLSEGSTTLSFQNRYVRKDGSERVLEWSAAPVLHDRLVYGVARDVTERRRTASEHDALRRIATLAVEGATPDELFAVVAEEVARVLGLPLVRVMRYEPDDTATECASFSTDGHDVAFRRRSSLEGTSVLGLVRETSSPARIDDFSGLEGEIAEIARSQGIKSSVGSPILVAGRLWGAMVASSTEELPQETERRLADFIELLASAIANAESREAIERLADEQASLRRVAELVAEGISPAEIFVAVSREVERVFRLDEASSDRVAVVRFDPGRECVLAGAAKEDAEEPIGLRWEPKQLYVSTRVLETGRSARIDEQEVEAVGGPEADALRLRGILCQVGSPIFVEGRLWGAVTLNTIEPLPADTEERLGKFTELVATAIANAESRSELAASRRRIVAASDETRRRIERDLHDGTQQRLVSLGLAVRAAEAGLPPDRDDLRNELSRVAMGLANAVEDLQEISRGIHPAILSKGGLAPALEGLAHRSPIPVSLELKAAARLPEPIEVAAYYVASEALANAAKHSKASRIDVSLGQGDGCLVLSVRDDGVGRARPGRGSGLVGLQDRVEALGGTITIDSAAGRGTCIRVTLPIATELGQETENVMRPQREPVPPTLA
jgi:PAS domain S-box-containing protein